MEQRLMLGLSFRLLGYVEVSLLCVDCTDTHCCVNCSVYASLLYTAVALLGAIKVLVFARA